MSTKCIVRYLLVMLLVFFSDNQVSGNSLKGDLDIHEYLNEVSENGFFEVCSENYVLPGYKVRSVDEVGVGIIYYPMGQSCNSVEPGPWPLVMVVPATYRKNEASQETYRSFCEHLASWGYIVVWYYRNMINDLDGDNLFKEHLLYSYNSSLASGHLVEDIALIGHSSGGATVRRAVKSKVLAQLNLKSVILLAPCCYDTYSSFDMSPYVSNLLIFGVSGDEDKAANGTISKENAVMNGGILDYDSFNGGHKDLIFVSSQNHTSSYGHYFQDKKFVKSYSVAFLQQHVKGISEYRKFFEGGQEPSDLIDTNQDANPPLFKKSHRDYNDILVADFEEVTSNEKLSKGISSIKNLSYLQDSNSPHNTKQNYISWDTEQFPSPFIEYTIPSDLGIVAPRYLAFDITQLNDGCAFENLNFKVYLVDSMGLKSYVDVKMFAEILPPFLPENAANVLKTVMQSVIIPTHKFMVDLNNIKMVGLEFSDPNFKKGTIALDAIRFSY